MNPPNPPKVLIADDELHMLRLLELTFKKGGFEVVCCRDGKEALAAVMVVKPQLVVLDMMMPGLDGLATLRQLKASAETKNIPVIVLSSKGHALTRVGAEMAGAAMFLTKPFSPSQLITEAKKILEPPAT
ncbi:MAG: response regulator [Verrucomicrobiae bacterium]